jgi:hypothetical protein
MGKRDYVNIQISQVPSWYLEKPPRAHHLCSVHEDLAGFQGTVKQLEVLRLIRNMDVFSAEGMSTTVDTAGEQNRGEKGE